jgi:23S rRNA (guanosine2251-2'-O)-methyltransferase
VTGSRRRNDRNDRRDKSASQPWKSGGGDWVWGRHAVQAALNNPRREQIRRLVLAPGRMIDSAGRQVERVETLDNAEIARLLPQGAVHQGYALLADPIEPAALDEFLDAPEGLMLMLDQVTDPQNVGAILRSAAAFGARAVIMQDRHAPPLTGAVAKAAVGAADLVPVCRVVNLSRALEQLAEAGWRSVGLDGGAGLPLHDVLDPSPTVLVLGSEGEGLRRLVAEHCDVTAKIPMTGGFESLNVATAASIALYEASRRSWRHG